QSAPSLSLFPYTTLFRSADVGDSTSLIKVLYRIQPDEVYHLAAQSHVRVSFDIPEYTGDVTGLGTVRILEAIRETGLKTKFYQADRKSTRLNSSHVSISY